MTQVPLAALKGRYFKVEHADDCEVLIREERSGILYEIVPGIGELSAAKLTDGIDREEG